MTAPVTDNAVLKLLNVESAYGPIKAIRGVSLQVRRGEIAAVLGSNGAGKTTILKTISGIIDPRKGSIEFKGENITAQDPALLALAADALSAIRGTKSAAKLSQRTEVSSIVVTGTQELLDSIALTLTDVRAAGSVVGDITTVVNADANELEFDVTLVVE